MTGTPRGCLWQPSRLRGIPHVASGGSYSVHTAQSLCCSTERLLARQGALTLARVSAAPGGSDECLRGAMCEASACTASTHVLKSSLSGLVCAGAACVAAHPLVEGVARRVQQVGAALAGLVHVPQRARKERLREARARSVACWMIRVFEKQLCLRHPAHSRQAKTCPMQTSIEVVRISSRSRTGCKPPTTVERAVFFPPS